MHTFIGVGSSLHPEQHIPAGLRRLDEVAPIRAASRWFRTPAIGRPDDPDFVNGVVQVHWPGPAIGLRRELRRVELEEGRRRAPDPFAPRTLDLDILLHGELVDAGLGIPDPDLGTRRHLALGILDIDAHAHLPGGRPLRDPGGPPLEVVALPWHLPRRGRAARPRRRGQLHEAPAGGPA